jgi:hypothetical protein
MRNVYTIVFAIIFCNVFFYSCSFPNKALINKINRVNGNLTFLTPLILSEIKGNISFSQTYKVKNDTLRKFLVQNGITEVSVQYYATDNSPKSSIGLFSFDSILIFHCNKSKDERSIYEDIIYSFAAHKPKNPLINLAGTKFKQINDSLWIMNTGSKVVLTL